MADEAQRLLAAEQAVQELLANLVRLRGEIEGYSHAKASLENARQEVAGLAGGLSKLVAGAGGVIGALGRLGTPEILSGIEGLRALCEESRDAIRSEQRSCLEEARKAVGEATAGTALAIRGAAVAVEGRVSRLDSRMARRNTVVIILVVLATLMSAASLALTIPGARRLLGI